MKSLNVITSVNAEGYIEHWHMNSGEYLNSNFLQNVKGKLINRMKD